MASEIRVNTINNRSGLGTISITDSGASFSGVVTATSFSGDLTGNVTSSSTSTFSNGLNVTSGNVGIGTDNPTSKLQVYNASSTPVVKISGPTSGSSALEFYASTTKNGALLVNSSGFLIAADNSNPITFNAGGSERLRITSSGNIGINSTSPKTNLDISQQTGAVALPQGTTAQRPSGNAPYIRYNTTNSALEFYNGTDWVEIISDYFPSGSVILG